MSGVNCLNWIYTQSGYTWLQDNGSEQGCSLARCRVLHTHTHTHSNIYMQSHPPTHRNAHLCERIYHPISLSAGSVYSHDQSQSQCLLCYRPSFIVTFKGLSCLLCRVVQVCFCVCKCPFERKRVRLQFYAWGTIFPKHKGIIFKYHKLAKGFEI